MSETADVLIVGAGIAGCATAYYLAGHGADVLIVDRGDVAGEASGVNMGGLGGRFPSESPTLDDALSFGSVALFDELHDAGNDIEFRLSGSIQAIRTEAEFVFAERQIANASPDDGAGLLTAREVRAIEPQFSAELLGAVVFPKYRGEADPVKTTRAFASAAEAQGARLSLSRAVTALDSSGGGYRLETTTGPIETKTLVLATGAWSAEAGQWLGLDIPIVPVRGQMWATAPLPPRTFHTFSATESPLAWSDPSNHAADGPPNLTHVDGRRVCRHLYGRQNAAGEIIFGGDRHAIGFERRVDAESIATNKAQATEVLPFLREHPTAREWSGFMPFSRDGKPLIGRLPGTNDAFIVSGLASSGFGRGPMAAKLLADLIASGTPDPVLTAADPARCVTTT